MILSLYQIDAFASSLFKGNPAAVVPLDEWIDERLMKQLAMENNLAETVFFVPSTDEYSDFHIRWFTPETEIDLCGHATLASAFVLFTILEFNKPVIIFQSKSGLLKINRNERLFEMEFPSWKPQPVSKYPSGLEEILGIKEIKSVHRYRDLLIEVNDDEEVQNAKPDFTALKKTGKNIILTAKGSGKVDFVSRFFAPAIGVDEDPVTGSAHSQLIPFWSEKLKKNKLFAKQLSKRGGEIYCKQLNDERVLMAGECAFFMKGEIKLYNYANF